MRIPASKLRRPRVGRSVIDRTWLLQLAPARPSSIGTADEERLELPVTLLAAPAGAGKTTLMSTWAKDRARRGHRVAWLSLDGNDNDRVVFWTGVLAAVRTAVGDSPDELTAATYEASTVLLGEVPPLVRLEELLDPSGPPLWLFLDDVQEIHAADVLADLDDLLRGRPSGLRLVLATRRDPPLALQRLLLSGQLREIRAADLALERSEVRELLGHHGVVLDEARLSLLVERTEGWAAGVRLAALTLAGAADPRAVVQDLAGDDRAVADYLAAEVLGRLGPVERAVLRVCAVPEQLTPELAVALSGEPAAAEVLEDLYRSNALVVRLAGPGRRYRVHALLRSHLLLGMQRTDPGRLAEAHARAACWFAEHDQVQWALTHALASGDGDLAVRMLIRHGPTLLADGRARALQRLVAGADPGVRSSPGARRLENLAHLALGDPAAVLPGPRPGAREEPTGEGEEPTGSRLRALEALERARHVDLGLSSAALDASDRVTGDDDVTLLLRESRGAVLLMEGKLAEADRELTTAGRIASARHNPHALLRTTAAMSALAAAGCDFRRSWELAEEVVRIAARSGSLATPEVGFALQQAAHCAYQRLDLLGARHLVERALRTLRHAPDAVALLSATALHAVLDVETGSDPPDAARRLRDCWTVVDGRPAPPALVAHVAFLQHRCSWLVSRPDWARDALVRLEDEVGAGGELEVLTAGEHLARGRGDAARRRLAAVLAGGVDCLLPTTRQLAWLLEALLAQRAGQPARTREALREVLLTAEDLGARHVFLELPGVLPLLDQHACRFGRLDPLVEDLRAALRDRGATGRPALTPRELEVLRHLPAQLTLEEIAESHRVSVNTVKTHVRSIYQKLGATSRRGAVATAQRRGLL
ncbi:LuxR C-terminal-related transcriptional regulator [Geodermatophilus sp. SYSU D00814]